MMEQEKAGTGYVETTPTISSQVMLISTKNLFFTKLQGKGLFINDVTQILQFSDPLHSSQDKQNWFELVSKLLS